VAVELFSLDVPEVSIIVEMEQTGTLQVTVSRPDGSPLEGAVVATWPNMLYYKGGATILGSEFQSRTQVEIQLIPPGDRKPRMSRQTPSQFWQKTDVKGKAILTGIPIGREQSLAIGHERFQLPKDFQNRRENRYKLDSATSVHREFKLQEISNANADDSQ